LANVFVGNSSELNHGDQSLNELSGLPSIGDVRKELSAALWRASWAPTLVFVAHVLSCYVFNGYGAFPSLDVPMHFLGGVAISFFLWTVFRACIRSGILGRPNGVALAVLTFSSTVSCAVLWEFAEFLSDRYLGTNSQVGLGDTLLDMLLGIIGGVVFVTIAWFRLEGHGFSALGGVVDEPK
jgi:hypothetical protein